MKLFLILTLTTLTLQAEAILQLDTKGHTGLIKNIIVTNDGSKITSASRDKTIRVWDVKSGVEKRKILGEIGTGTRGSITAIALSKDDKYLAVGGNIKRVIRIYNYKTGQLLQVLKSHKKNVLDLSFSQDSHYLISSSMDRTAKIWDVRNDFTLTDTINFHTDYVYAARIIKKNNQYFAVTVGDDKQVALYDMRKKEIIRSNKHTNRLRSMETTDANGGNIAFCGTGKEILIYDYNLNFINKIESETTPFGLSYSKNGKYLIAGTSKSPYNVNIYQTNNSYKQLNSLKKHTNTTVALAYLDNKTAVSGGGNNKEIYVWDIESLRIKQKMVGVGSSVYNVGIYEDSIAFSNRWKSEFKKEINLKTQNISYVNDPNTFKKISTKSGNYSLKHTKGGPYNRKRGVLNILKNRKIETQIIKDSNNGYQHNCYGWYNDFIVSGASHGHIYVYTKYGEKVASLKGHTGDIMSIALDGDRLVSGSNDQTIRVWDLSTISSKNTKKQVIYPMLNIFVSNDDEWVIWSKSGYFASSVNGDQYVGYHINQGPDKEAYFVSSAKYYDKLYRPDIIQAILETGSEEKAIASISKNSNIEETDIISEMPPILTLLSESNPSTKSNSTTIDFAIKSNTEIEKLIVTRNGEKIQTHIPNGEKASIDIELDDGENIISIRAKNKYSLSDALLIRANKKSNGNLSRTSGTTSDSENTQAIYKPTLYLLSIGVSQYENSEYNLDVADKDAKSIVEMFQKQEGKIYKKVVTKVLLNDSANKDNILEALDWIERETTQRDMVIIFVAGHGINDDKGNYYFMAHDSDVNKLRRTAIRWIEIKDTLSDLPSKVILMVDTCHSGNILGQEKRRDITGAIKSIINSGTGSVIMTASTGRGYSIENKSWGHGAFTKALLEGLNEAKADYNDNRDITIKEIDLYITDRVKTLTKGKQKPTTIVPESIPDFAIGVR